MMYIHQYMLSAKKELLFLLPVLIVASIALRHVFIAELPPKKKRTGFIEAQNLTVHSDSNIKHFALQNTESINPGKFNSDDFIYFVNKSIDTQIVLNLPQLAAGQYALELYLAQASDFGSVDIYLNDRLIAEQIDLYNASTTPYELALMGTYTLKEEGNFIKFKIIATNSKSRPPHYQFGIDGLILTPTSAPARDGALVAHTTDK